VQVKPDRGTEPLDVGGLHVQLTVSTSSLSSNVPLVLAFWNRLIVAEVNAMSVMFSVHWVRAVGSARDRRHRRVGPGRDRDIPVLDVACRNGSRPRHVDLRRVLAGRLGRARRVGTRCRGIPTGETNPSGRINAWNAILNVLTIHYGDRIQAAS
jgi:hypothetical protein